MSDNSGEQGMDGRSLVAGRYRTVRELADYLGVGIHVVYRHINAKTPPADRWPCSRTSSSPRAPVRFAPAQVAVIEELMKRNGERGMNPQSARHSDAREQALIDRSFRRLNRHAVARDAASKGLHAS